MGEVRYSHPRRDRIETGEKPTPVVMMVEQKEVSMNADLGPSWTNEECGYNLLSEYQLLRYGISVLKVASKDSLQLCLQDAKGRKFPINSAGTQFRIKARTYLTRHLRRLISYLTAEHSGMYYPQKMRPPWAADEGQNACL